MLLVGATFSKQEDDLLSGSTGSGCSGSPVVRRHSDWGRRRPATIVANDGAAAFTLGLRGDRQNLQRACRRRRVHHAYMQNTGEGSRYAIAGRATGATAG